MLSSIQWVGGGAGGRGGGFKIAERMKDRKRDIHLQSLLRKNTF